MIYPDFMYYYFAFIVFLFGASVGSFLNVCIYRIPEELSVVKPRSFCPKCKTPISWYCNVPMLSYVFLGGKCKYCKVPISPRYFGVELLTALLFLLVWLKLPAFYSAPLGMTEASSFAQVACYWLVVFGLVMGSFIDIDHYILPDRVTLGGIVLGLICSAIFPELHGENITHLDSFLISLGAAAIGFGSLWLVAIFGRIIFKKEAMGFGDVKLMGAIGAFFGFSSILFVLICASFIGSFFGIGCILMKKKELQSRIPFGPFLAAAVLIFMFWGPALVDAYINLLTIGN